MIKKTYNWIKTKIKKFWKWLLGGVAIATIGTGLLMNVGAPIEPFPSLPGNGNLIIYVGDDPSGSYEDGDVMMAVNSKRMLDVNTQMIVGQNFKNALRNGDTYVIPNSLHDIYKANTMQYKFERISQTEVKRTDLTDNSFTIFSDIPNEDNEHIYVQAYIDYALKSPRHQIFGTKGSEYWYGGRTITTLASLNKVWVEIEKQTEHRKADNMDYNFAGTHNIKIEVDDFTDATAGELTSQLLGDTLVDGEYPVLKERRYKVNYRALDLQSKHDKNNILQLK